MPQLDEMTRRAQEKLLIAQVVREIQSNLGQIEQALDTFFREPDHGIFGLSYVVSMGQWLSLPMIAFGVWLLLARPIARDRQGA